MSKSKRVNGANKLSNKSVKRLILEYSKYSEDELKAMRERFITYGIERLGDTQEEAEWTADLMIDAIAGKIADD